MMHPLEHDFHLTATQMGIILSSYLWSYTLLQIPVGAMLDKIGIKWLMRIGTQHSSCSWDPHFYSTLRFYFTASSKQGQLHKLDEAMQHKSQARDILEGINL